jgi:hypothetical protein
MNPFLCAALAVTFLLMGAEAWFVYRALLRQASETRR